MPQSDNKRIAKNTVYLYIRMIIVMAVTFYTARVVLNVLGFQDYGIYNLVGGVVVLFAFLNNSMTGCTQRYLCVSIGKKDQIYEAKVFTCSVISHIIISILFLVLAETVGLWFIIDVLNIPQESKTSAIIVYQIALLTTLFNIFKVPFNAAIIAHERMNFYAISSIIEAALNLTILIPLVYISSNKLILYSSLISAVSFFILLWYLFYTYKHFPNCRFRPEYLKKSLIKEMLKFTGWSNFSSIANLSAKQGMNFIFNIFYGVIINASVGIMQQVNSAVYSFINNFQVAINPPIIKLYTNSEWDNLKKLYIRAAKYSFFLMLLLSFPLILNINPILKLWLKDVPEYTGWFCALSLISLLPNTIGGPIWTIIQASGNLSKYQIIISSLILFNLPLDYLLLYWGMPPYILLIVTLIINSLVILIGIKFVSRCSPITQSDSILKIIIPCAITAGVALLVGYIINLNFDEFNGNLLNLFFKILFEVFSIILIIFLLGLKRSERSQVKRLIFSHIKFK